MRAASLRRARWLARAQATGAPVPMQTWMASPGSLTARLIAHSEKFRVQRLHQRRAVCLADEAALIGPGRVWEREVLLRCNGEPVKKISTMRHACTSLACVCEPGLGAAA